MPVMMPDEKGEGEAELEYRDYYLLDFFFVSFFKIALKFLDGFYGKKVRTLTGYTNI